MERKNPLGLIAAYRRAFREDDRALLVIKTLRGAGLADDYKRLRDAANANGAPVRIIDEMYSGEDMHALMDCCDSYVSLHRAEGFGLTLAEAMLMGKPVIATGYSGNMDFMTAENSYPVQYEEATFPIDWGPYRQGWLCAQPDEVHAAECMRQVYEDRTAAQTIAERGRKSAREQFSPQRAGRRMTDRLKEARR